MQFIINVVIEDGGKLPSYGSEYATGADLSSIEDVILEPGDVYAVDTGLRMQPDRFCDMQIRPRSGLALKHKITVLNTPGTIDFDFTGRIKVILINHGKEPFHITKEMRIAQLVALVPGGPERAFFCEVKELIETKRGSGGFGSTGI